MSKKNTAILLTRLVLDLALLNLNMNGENLYQGMIKKEFKNPDLGQELKEGDPNQTLRMNLMGVG